MKIKIIINPAAGRVKLNRVLPAIRNYFLKHGTIHDISITKNPGDARKLARQSAIEGTDIIVAAGGDGTVNEIVNGIHGTQAALGIIPIGTINILANELKIPLNINAACKTILYGDIKKIDLGKAGSHKFILMAGFGLDAYAIYRVDVKLKKYIGGLAYILAGLYSAFRYPPHKIKINIDNSKIKDEGYFAIIGNAGAYGGIYKMAPYAKLDDGLLDICIFKRSGPIECIRYLAGVTLGQHLKFPDVEYYRGKTIRLTSDKNVLIHTDGDLTGSLPMTVSVLPAAIKVIVPNQIKQGIRLL